MTVLGLALVTSAAGQGCPFPATIDLGEISYRPPARASIVVTSHQNDRDMFLPILQVRPWLPVPVQQLVSQYIDPVWFHPWGHQISYSNDGSATISFYVRYEAEIDLLLFSSVVRETVGFNIVLLPTVDEQGELKIETSVNYSGLGWVARQLGAGDRINEVSQAIKTAVASNVTTLMPSIDSALARDFGVGSQNMLPRFSGTEHFLGLDFIYELRGPKAKTGVRCGEAAAVVATIVELLPVAKEWPAWSPDVKVLVDPPELQEYAFVELKRLRDFAALVVTPTPFEEWEWSTWPREEWIPGPHVASSVPQGLYVLSVRCDGYLPYERLIAMVPTPWADQNRRARQFTASLVPTEYDQEGRSTCGLVIEDVAEDWPLQPELASQFPALTAEVAQLWWDERQEWGENWMRSGSVVEISNEFEYRESCPTTPSDAAYLIDGETTAWFTTSPDFPHGITIDFGQPRQFSRVAFVNYFVGHLGPFGVASANEISIEASSDGVSFFGLGRVALRPVTGNPPALSYLVESFLIDYTTAQFIRVTLLDNQIDHEAARGVTLECAGAGLIEIMVFER